MGRSPESPFSYPPCPTPIEQAQEAVEDEKEPIPLQAMRRRSSTWKGLKRQLSRVDIKLKNPLKEKRHSIFYAGALPGSEVEHLEEDLENLGSQDSAEDVTVVSRKWTERLQCLIMMGQVGLS